MAAQRVPTLTKGGRRAVQQKLVPRELAEDSPEDLHHEGVVQPNVLMAGKSPSFRRGNVQKGVSMPIGKPKIRKAEVAPASGEKLAGVEKATESQQKARGHAGPAPKTAKRDHGPKNGEREDRTTTTRLSANTKANESPGRAEIRAQVLPAISATEDNFCGQILGGPRPRKGAG